jgi:hypothetical protein
MTLIKNLFIRNPLDWQIPNDGVAEVEQLETLQQELRMFVCDGEYATGLERILSSYNSNWTGINQPAVWISGFYGTGKSHLAKALHALWENRNFPDGSDPEGVTELPVIVSDHLRELRIHGKQAGGVFAASGKLQQAIPLRKGILSIIFKRLDLPEDYQVTRFILWMKKEEVFEQVAKQIKEKGRDPDIEFGDMYASPVLADALMDSLPSGWSKDINSTLDKIDRQFPVIDPDQDISNDQMLDVMTLLFSENGKMKCSLLVLDELQQYIGTSNERGYDVQQVVEACSKRFGGRLLFVGTGQSAIVDTAYLDKLQGRFTVRVHLSDTDVVNVTRKLVLQKTPDQTENIKEMLRRCSGEIDRHLRDSMIGPKPEDQELLHVDYPILPVRRRFWERSLRALDKGGVEGQLRTQLKLVLDAAKSVANDALGKVVSSDFIYGQIYSKLTQSGVLTKEINETILKQRDGTDDGQKRYQLAALIYLIGELPPNLGVKADAETLADLLVSDLNVGSTQLRRDIPDILSRMLGSGDIMQIGKAFHIQTPEGSDWESEFRSNYSNWMKDDVKIADYRYTLIKNRFHELLNPIVLTQGKSRTPRKIELYFTLDKPQASGEGVPVWIRDGWSDTEKNFRNDAHQEGVDSPYILVYLPKKNVQPLKAAIANWRAAVETLEAKGNPSGDEGKRARAAMKTRQNQYADEVRVLLHDVFNQAIVLQGGGNEISTGSFRDSVQKAAEKALVRMYSEFSIGDNPDWAKVKDRVKRGDGAPLKVVGFSGEAQDHEVCKELLKIIGAGKKGTEIRKFLSTSPFGWPKDTIDSALIALVGAGFLDARQSGVSIEAKYLDSVKIGKSEFKAIQVQFGVGDRLKVRKVLQSVGVNHKPNEELQVLPALRDRLEKLINSAGGDEPLPKRPSRIPVEDMFSKAGNELGVAIANESENLTRDIKTWAGNATKIEQRKDRWERLNALIQYAKDLDIYEEIGRNIDAINSGRQLLNDPDPVTVVCDTLTDALRDAINNAFQAYDRSFSKLETQLGQNPAWTMLTPEQQGQLVRQESFLRIPKPHLGSEKDVQAALKMISLDSWKNQTDALPKRFDNLRSAAIKLTEPQAIQVSLPSKTLKTEQEVNEYLDAAKREIMKHINASKPVII